MICRRVGTLICRRVLGSIICKTRESGRAICWWIAGGAISWLSRVSCTICNCTKSTVSTDPVWSSNVHERSRWVKACTFLKSFDTNFPIEGSICFWLLIFKCCATVSWSTGTCWVCIALESLGASSGWIARCTVPSNRSIRGASGHCR